MKRVVLVFVVLLAVQAQPDPEFVPREETECWECHKPGERALHMDPPFAPILALDNNSADVTIVNIWESHLDFVQVSMDLTQAPGVQFAASRAPILDRFLDGTIQAAPSNELQIHQRYVQMEPNATFVRIQLVPSDTDPTIGPDLQLRVQPEPGGSSRTIDQNGRGQSESLTYTLQDLSTIASTSWSVEAGMYTLDTAGLSATPPGDYDYTLVIDVYFNSTQRIRYATSDAGIRPGEQMTFQWPIEIIGVGPHDVASFVNATMTYNHGDVRYPDIGWVRVEATTLEDSPVPSIPTDGSPIPTTEEPFVSLTLLGEMVGYLAAFSLIFSVTAGGMFGKGSRRVLNKWFGNARRRIAFHNFISYALTLAAIVHIVLFIIEVDYHWSVGLLLGGAATLTMFGLGFTGALQIPMIRRFGYSTWRNWHLWLAIFTLLLTAAHLFLDGRNFQPWAQPLNWKDPVVQFFNP